jgi:methanogenic corrinoid protein MtbC1
MDQLSMLLKDLDEKQVIRAVKKKNEEGFPALDILQELQEGMRMVGEEYSTGRYYLPELIMSATIFQQAADILKDRLTQSHGEAKWGTMVIGTVKDDIHDIGKNIASTLLACRGFRVVDLGVNIAPEGFVQAIKEHQPKIVGLSCLLTTCFESLKATVDAIKREGLRTGLPIIIGGAIIDEAVLEYAGADAFCKDANEGVLTSIRLVGGAL